MKEYTFIPRSIRDHPVSIRAECIDDALNKLWMLYPWFKIKHVMLYGREFRYISKIRTLERDDMDE